jgi:hydrogenase nickel incorporation protein HypA/HybF
MVTENAIDMHEMGVVLNIVKSAERFAAANNASRLGYVTVEVGELTGVVPNYLTSFWEMGTKGTICEGSKLVIEIAKGMVRCLACQRKYPIMENLVNSDPICPHCQNGRFSVLAGREVMITEIGVPDE